MPAQDPGRSCGPSRIPAARRSNSHRLCSAGPAPVRHACAIGRSKPHKPNGHDNRNGFGDRSVRQALAGEARWSWVRFPVATASPALGHGPADAAWLPLGETWPTPPHHRPGSRRARRGRGTTLVRKELTAVA